MYPLPNAIIETFDIEPVEVSTLEYALAPLPSPISVMVGEMITLESVLQVVENAVLTVKVLVAPA